MFGHAAVLVVFVCMCVCVYGIHNAAIDAAAGTSKHAHSPYPTASAGMSGYAVSNRQIVCYLLSEADLHLSEPQIVWARSIGHG